MSGLSKYLLRGFVLLAVLTLGGCDYVLFDPKGEIGVGIRWTLLSTVAAMLLIVIPTLILTVWIVVKYRKGKEQAYTPEWDHSGKIELLAWGLPILIVIVLATITYIQTHKLDPRKRIVSDKELLTIQVVALDWKWLFIYPEEGIATINEIAMPVDRPVEFLITSNSTMNSFFIPQLGGQIYAMAGMENRLNLIANEAGVYYGISSNYSGFGFTGMRFKAHAVTDQQFDEWVNKVRQSPKKLNSTTYPALEERSRDNPVEYFGEIDTLQFKNIIEKFTGVK